MSKTIYKLIMILVFAVFLVQACQPASTEAPVSTPGLAQPTDEAPIPSEEVALETVHLTASVLPFLSYAPFFIAQEEGYFAEQGLEVEFVRIDKTSEAIPALVQGDLDIAAGFFDASTMNAIAKGSNIKYVSDKGFLDPNGCDASTFVARKDLVESGVLDDLKNLAGMKIALTPASSAEYALDMLLKDAGLSSADVEILNIPLPARLEGLGNGTVDIAAVADPWTYRMVSAGYGLVWHPWQTYLPDLQFSVIMFGPNLLEKHQDVGVRFLTAYLKAVRQYNQGKTDRNIEVIATFTQMDPEEVKGSCWMSMTNDGIVDLSGLPSFVDWALTKGYLDAAVTPEQIWDPSFIEAANKALAGN